MTVFKQHSGLHSGGRLARNLLHCCKLGMWTMRALVYGNADVMLQEDLSQKEQLDMMQISSSAASVVKDVFLKGDSVKRVALLHAKVNLEGLERVSRNLSGTVYELQLGC